MSLIGTWVAATTMGIRIGPMVVLMDPLPMGAGRVLLRLENRVRIGNRAQFRCIEDGFVAFAIAQFMISSNRTTMLGCQRQPRTATHSSGNTLRMTFLLTKPMGICLDKREKLEWPRCVHLPKAHDQQKTGR